MGGSQSGPQLWDGYYRQALEAEKKISKEILQMIIDGKLDALDEDAIRLVSQEKQAEYAEENKRILKKIWERYDADGNGEMDQKEFVRVSRDALTALRNWLPKMNKTIQEINVQHLSLYLSSEQVKQVKASLRMVLPAMEEKFEVWISNKLSNIDATARSMWRKMDPNEDGSVNEDEFMQNFTSAATEMMDPIEAMKAIEGELAELYFKGELKDPDLMPKKPAKSPSLAYIPVEPTPKRDYRKRNRRGSDATDIDEDENVGNDGKEENEDRTTQKTQKQEHDEEEQEEEPEQEEEEEDEDEDEEEQEQEEQEEQDNDDDTQTKH